MAMPTIGADSATAAQKAQPFGSQKSATTAASKASDPTAFKPGEGVAVKKAAMATTRATQRAENTVETQAAKGQINAEAPTNGIPLPEQHSGKTIDTTS